MKKLQRTLSLPGAIAVSIGGMLSGIFVLPGLAVGITGSSVWLGFLVAAFLAGKFNFDNNLIKNFLKLTFATSFIYILGMFWLGTLIGWDKPIFKLGAHPFLLAELFKILLATFAINQIKKIKKIF